VVLEEPVEVLQLLEQELLIPVEVVVAWATLVQVVQVVLVL
jgi:hypothetical protein